MNRQRSTALAATLLLAVVATATPVPAQEPADEVTALILEGYEQLSQRQAHQAVRTFKRADSKAGGASPEALLGLAHAYGQVRAYAASERAARKALSVPGAGEELRGAAHNLVGIALLQQAGDDREKLAPVESEFRQAMELAGDADPVFGLNLAEVLLRLGRGSEAEALLEEFIEREPHGPDAARARSLLDDPRRASDESLAPDFSLVTLDGEYLTPDDFAGRVVLLDFWGTWCPPCRAATPALKRIYSRHEKQDAFAMVGIATDSERGLVESYVAEHGMEWVQAWDADRSASYDAFRVRNFPTYMILDHEGRVAYRVSGWGEHIRRDLELQLGRQLRRARKASREDD